MRICVFGLWHLGCVTAACAAEHFSTWACDPDPATIADLQAGNPPIVEPGLQDLIRSQLAVGRLAFTMDIADAVRNADVVWVTFDTPVDENDVADAEAVARQIRGIFPFIADGTTVLISSQVPVGFTARMESEFRAACPTRHVGFAYSPENLRLGKALEVFRGSERILIGVRDAADQPRLHTLLGKFCGHLDWMAVESAELTKHALNAFLASSIAFINEIATLAEYTDANAKEVERGLKSDIRIGPRAYLNPGAPFGGGTLGRDVSYLAGMATTAGLSAPLLKSINTSNIAHKEWSRRKLLQLLGNLEGKAVAVLGLTYKPGTSTLRRSVAVELCQWLNEQGAAVRAYDPAIQQLPAELTKFILLCNTIHDALDSADALVIATEWPEFQHISCDDLGSMRGRVIADPNRFLNPQVRHEGGSIYAAVGSHAGAE